MAVGGREIGDERRQVFGQTVSRIVRHQHLGDVGDPGRALRRGGTVLAGDQDIDFLGHRPRRADRYPRRRRQRIVRVIGQDQRRHQTTWASWRNLATSSEALVNISPPPRTAGSVTLRISIRGAASTPSSSGVVRAIGLRRAFMMLGNDA